jgi:fructosamine-3-kinase
MSQEMDISWQVLRRIVGDWAGSTAELAEVNPLDGGAISTTVALTLADGQRAVCKISSHRVDRSYINESHQLGLLSQLGIPVPVVYAAKVGSLDDPHSFILMEFVDGVPLSEARKRCTAEQFDQLQIHLAELLLKIHDHSSGFYGRVMIDPPPTMFSTWPEFYRAVFDPICDGVFSDHAVPLKCRKQIGKTHERLERLLQHDDVPRLVHWDIWSTNILCRPDSDGNWHIAALLDPNCKFAHAEAELAYMALFHTATPAFMKAYQQSRRLSDDYHRIRKPVYQLYSLLNHVHLFGQDYVKPLMAAVDKLGSV